MTDEDARRPKRRCAARSRNVSSMPSAIHYVGYVEEDETPEMIMTKFAELERIQVAAQEAVKDAPTLAALEDEEIDKENTLNAEKDSATAAEVSAPAVPVIAGDQTLTDDQLLEVFKQTSMFNVRTALQDNAMLMGIDEVLGYTGDRYGPDELLSDDEDLLRSFWSDDEDWGDNDDECGKRGRRRGSSGRTGGGGGGGARLQRNLGALRARHNIVTAYNPATQALVRRKVRVEDPDSIAQIRVPAAPLPLSWGRAVKPYIPVHMRGDRKCADAVHVAMPPPPMKAASNEVDAARAIPEPPPCTYLELPSLSSLDVKNLPNAAYQAVLINPGWEKDADTEAATALSNLESLPIPRLVPTGFVFIWVPKYHVAAVCKQMAKWGYTYIENLTWVWLSPANKVLTLKSQFIRASHLTLYMFRVADKGKDIELRHQRNPDVTFDCIAASPEGGLVKSIPNETFVAVETLLPTGKGKLLELWSERGAKRPGWTHVVEVGVAEV